jgi:hypothetical protein
MSDLVKVARYHLVNRVGYILMPSAWLAFIFLVNLIIIWIINPPASGGHTGALASIFIIFLALGIQTMVQSLPFGFALGMTRRAYYLGTILLVIGLAVVYGLALTVLQEVERATGGWGVHLGFFRVSFILNGPWYLTWLTSSVGLGLIFVYGMWFGLVYRRWNLVGLLTFIAAQITVLLAVALAVTWAHVWHGVGHFFSTLSAVGVTGVLAALALLLVVGGAGTIRRVTV